MAAPRTALITTTGTIVMDCDFMQSPFNMSWGMDLPSGATGSYTVNYTLDDLNGTPAPTWNADSVAGTAQTTAKNNAYSSPIRGLQIVVTAVTGTLRFNMLQGMSSR